MKKYIFTLAGFMFLCQINFAQNFGTTNPVATSGSNASAFFYADIFGGNTVHIIWENVDNRNIKEVSLEKSADGVNFTLLAKADVSSLIDIHSNNYPAWIDYYNHILMSSEHGTIRYIYNDVLPDKSSAGKTIWYRYISKSADNNIFISFPKSVGGNANPLNNSTQGNSGQATQKGGGGAKGCPPVATPPAGSVSLGQTNVYNTQCCSWTETLYQDTVPLLTNCGGSSYAWCCNNNPDALNCPSGYSSDPCCVHYCDQYAQCSCIPWQCCTGGTTQQWIVTQSTNLSPMSLTANVQDASCYNSNDGFISLTVNNAVPPVTYAWSNGATSQNLTNIPAGTYTVTIADSLGCSIDSTFHINATLPAPLQAPVICIVSVDTALNHNVVIWEKPGGTNGINQYYIYRETAQAGVYALIGFQNASLLSTFVDVTSNPAQQSYRYELAIFDNCGSLTAQSPFHETIHLTASTGINNEINLIWNSYLGFTFSTYDIYRGNSMGTLTLLNSVSSNNNSYTDLNPPLGNVYYLVEAVRPVPCNPSKEITSTKSNILQMALTGISENSISEGIRIYPNPGTGIFTVSLEGENMKNMNCTVSSAIGQAIINTTINSPTANINLTGAAKGIYFITLRNDKLNRVAKIVVE